MTPAAPSSWRLSSTRPKDFLHRRAACRSPSNAAFRPDDDALLRRQARQVVGLAAGARRRCAPRRAGAKKGENRRASDTICVPAPAVLFLPAWYPAGRYKWLKARAQSRSIRGEERQRAPALARQSHLSDWHRQCRRPILL